MYRVIFAALASMALQTTASSAEECPWKLKDYRANLNGSVQQLNTLAHRILAHDDNLRDLHRDILDADLIEGCGSRITGVIDEITTDLSETSEDVEMLAARSNRFEECNRSFTQRITADMKKARDEGDSNRLMSLNTISNVIAELDAKSLAFSRNAKFLLSKHARMGEQTVSFSRMCNPEDLLSDY